MVSALALVGGCAIVLDFDGYQAEDAAGSSQGGGGGAATSGTSVSAAGGDGGSGAQGGSGGSGGGCTSPSQCPGDDTECAQRTCVAGVCGMAFAVEGTEVTDPVPGDCQKFECNAVGQIVMALGEDPLTDNNDCTNDVCLGGTTVFIDKEAGDPCGVGVNTQCDGLGECRGCQLATDCPMTTMCNTWMCTSDVNGSKCLALELVVCGTCQYCLDGTCTDTPLGNDPDGECPGACNGSGMCE